MAAPVETIKKRRRWSWMVSAALLLIGGPVAWRFRPLNANESQLVGPWKQVLDYEQFRFTSNRRFTVQTYGVYGPQDGTVTSSGSWRCRGDRLVLNYDETWEDLGFRIVGRRRFLNEFSGRLVWHSRDEFLWLVVSDPQDEPLRQIWRRRDLATEKITD